MAISYFECRLLNKLNFDIAVKSGERVEFMYICRVVYPIDVLFNVYAFYNQ
jgi:hypothetical protein